MPSSWRADRLLPAVLPVLALVAEGAWLTVAYVAVETTLAGRPPLLGTLEMTVAAGAGALAVRRRWINPDEEPLRFFGALVAVGAIGWLWSAAPRELLAGGDLASAVGLHPGGWLTIVAFMRGTGRGIEVDDRALTRLVLVGVPLLAVPWIVGQLGPAALRPTFVTEAFVASLTFVSAGFMAAGLARLGEIGRETGIDWRTSRSWFGLVLAVLAVVLAIGVPAAYLLGLPADAVLRGVIGPVAQVAGYLLLAVAYLLGLLAALVTWALSSLGIALPPPMTPEELSRLGEVEPYTFEQLRGPLLTVAIAIAAIALLAVVVVRTWLRRRIRGRDRTVSEERSFRLPRIEGLRIAPPTIAIPRRPRLRGPRDAEAAYLAALEALDRHAPGLERREHETPRAHAARVLGAAPATGAALRGLQADYALARYGGRTLPDREHRRAVGRWRRLRDRLRRLGSGPA